MKNFIKILFQPYPIRLSWKLQMKEATYSAVFIILFLFLFRPFEMKIAKDYELAFLGVCVAFGLVSWSVCAVFYGFHSLFPTIFKEEEWNVWKEIVATFVLIFFIANANMLFSNYYFELPSLWQNFWKWQKITFAIGIFPTFFSAFSKQTKLSQKYKLESAQISHELESRSSNMPSDTLSPPITLFGENQNEQLVISSSQLLYITSMDNYVEIFYLENEHIKQTLFRSSLKKIEATLANFPEFFRCHRAYIVNLQKVRSLSGNAQGYKLHLAQTSAVIPVSRSLNEEIARKFAKG